MAGKSASSLIGMLLVLLIIAILSVFSINTFKEVSPTGFTGKNTSRKSIEQQFDSQVREIESYRKQIQDFNSKSQEF